MKYHKVIALYMNSYTMVIIIHQLPSIQLKYRGVNLRRNFSAHLCTPKEIRGNEEIKGCQGKWKEIIGKSLGNSHARAANINLNKIMKNQSNNKKSRTITGNQMLSIWILRKWQKIKTNMKSGVYTFNASENKQALFCCKPQLKLHTQYH